MLLSELPIALFFAGFFILGLIFGSFGNVLITRIPGGRSIGGRSACTDCGHILRASDLVPVLSYCILRGKCAHCKARISALYPTVEILSAFLFVFALYSADSVPSAILLSMALWSLLLIAAVDIRTQEIPDVLSGMFIVLSLLFMMERGVFDPWAFVLGVGFFGIQWVLSKGKWIGSGDVLLSIGISALLGKWQLVIVMLFVAYIVGAAVAVFLLLTKRIGRSSTIAFGPFIALGAFVALWKGEEILSCVLRTTQECGGLFFFS